MKRALGAIVLVILISSSANAALLSRAGGQAYYDTDLNITWLQDANLAATNTFGVSGIGGFAPGTMFWDTAQAWIAAMNNANYLGANNWRLPPTVQPDASCSFQDLDSYGFNCTGSEMGHLFYQDLGGVAGQSIATIHNENYSLFQNIRPSIYWSGTEDTFQPALGDAWDFWFSAGLQGGNYKDHNYYAWAVSPGDTVVPLPTAAFLFPSALALLGWLRRSAFR